MKKGMGRGPDALLFGKGPEDEKNASASADGVVQVDVLKIEPGRHQPRTFFDDELKGGATGIDNNLIPALVEKLAPEFDIQTGKTYVQTRGPRFETKAEIQIIKHWGDVVGMTAAHEADLCREIGLRYNSLAIIDNYANGLAGTEIDFVKFKARVLDNQARVNRLFERLLEIFK